MLCTAVLISNLLFRDMSKGRSYGAGICPHIQEARSCLTTSGPGAINLITPLQDALKDDIPLVVLTGEVPTYAIGTEALQEAEVIGITGPCMKWDIRDLAAQINDAFRIVSIPSSSSRASAGYFRQGIR